MGLIGRDNGQSINLSLEAALGGIECNTQLTQNEIGVSMNC